MIADKQFSGTEDCMVGVTPRALLIVDDDPALLDALSTCLRLRLPDYHVDTVASGPDALTRLQHGPYDLVLCDLRMPVMDGMALLDEVKRISSKASVVLMTAHGDASVRQEAQRRGAAAFIEKPFEREVFIEAIVTLLEHHP